MNLTGHVRPAAYAPRLVHPAALPSLAQAYGGASPDGHARPDPGLTGPPCHRFSAGRGDGRVPSATFAHIAFLAYLGFGVEATSAAVSPR